MGYLTLKKLEIVVKPPQPNLLPVTLTIYDGANWVIQPTSEGTVNLPWAFPRGSQVTLRFTMEIDGAQIANDYPGAVPCIVGSYDGYSFVQGPYSQKEITTLTFFPDHVFDSTSEGFGFFIGWSEDGGHTQHYDSPIANGLPPGYICVYLFDYGEPINFPSSAQQVSPWSPWILLLPAVGLLLLLFTRKR
jgi:hypothetical protein